MGEKKFDGCTLGLIVHPIILKSAYSGTKWGYLEVATLSDWNIKREPVFAAKTTINFRSDWRIFMLLIRYKLGFMWAHTTTTVVHEGLKWRRQPKSKLETLQRWNIWDKTSILCIFLSFFSKVSITLKMSTNSCTWAVDTCFNSINHTTMI